MSKILKNIIGIIIFLIIVFITLFILFKHLTTKSFYEETGRTEVEGLREKTEIFKDNFGVPHIVAGNENDIYFALGYIHAQDRMWQMDISRRVAEGKLSEIFGYEVIEYDKLFRTIGINKISEKLYTELSPKSKEILEQYTNGINAFLNKRIKQLPLEFDVLDYKPEKWKPEHSIMVMRLVGWELTISWYTDFVFGKIAERFGPEMAVDFFPSYPANGPFIVKPKKTTSKISFDTNSTINQPAHQLLKEYSNHIYNESFPIQKKHTTLYDHINSYATPYNNLTSLLESFVDKCLSYNRFIGKDCLSYSSGSNSWVISGKKSETEKPILANDPHLLLSIPSRWYEVHLNRKDIHKNISGFTIPGTPGIAVGCNDNISWGITNLMNDDLDFYLLERDTIVKTNYIYQNKIQRPDSTPELIKVKDIKEEVEFTVWNTELGPIVSELEKTGFSNESRLDPGEKYYLALKWTGEEFSDEILAFYEINNAKNWNEFRSGLKHLGLPALNFIYADNQGNIGYQCAGKIPVRKSNFAYIPQTTENEWVSYMKFEELPASFNPEENYIITANNPPTKEFSDNRTGSKNYISILFEPPYRAERIDSLLSTRNFISVNDFKLIQTDIVSLQAKEFCSYLFEAFSDSNYKSEDTRYVNILKRWDYKFNTSSPAPLLFAQFEIELYKTLFEEKLGTELFKNYIMIKNVPVRTASRILSENTSWLLDIDTNKSKIENRNQILVKSFKNAVTKIKETLKTEDYNKWTWGELHKITMNHPLGVVTALAPILNIGPYEISGSGTTVSNAEYSLQRAFENQNYSVFVGTSMRMIADMSNTGNTFTILPPGQSGQPEHPNYSDQMRLWLNGEYKITYTGNDFLKYATYKHLILDPKTGYRNE